MRKIILLLLTAIMVVSCHPKTTYVHDYEKVVMDSTQYQQYALDLLHASADRHYTDKTKKRYDISTAVNESEWFHRELVEGLSINNRDKAGNTIFNIFVPEAHLTPEQRYYFDLSKNNGSVQVIVKHPRTKPITIEHED